MKRAGQVLADTRRKLGGQVADTRLHVFDAFAERTVLLAELPFDLAQLVTLADRRFKLSSEIADLAPEIIDLPVSLGADTLDQLAHRLGLDLPRLSVSLVRVSVIQPVL